jgi:2-keto-4-pentenoate hydratase
MSKLISSRKSRFTAVLATAAVSLGLVAGPAAAQPRQEGLVNVNITDVLTNNEVAVQIPIGVAANVCGVQANVLAQGGLQEPVDCTASNTADLPVRFRP